MSEYTPVHPFWRALAGAGFAFGIGLAGLRFGFWAAVLLLVLVVIGGVVGVLAINGD